MVIIIVVVVEVVVVVVHNNNSSTAGGRRGASWGSRPTPRSTASPCITVICIDICI